MTVERWDPFREFRGPFRHPHNIDRRWAGFGYRPVEQAGRTGSWRIPLDVVRDGESVIVEASLPGVKPADISVTIEDNVLRILGTTGADDEPTEGTYLLSERRTGTFERALRLPESVDAEKAHTSYEAGVLTVTLPKLEAKKAKDLSFEVKGEEVKNGEEVATV